jgi:hypothetical protein
LGEVWKKKGRKAVLNRSKRRMFKRGLNSVSTSAGTSSVAGKSQLQRETEKRGFPYPTVVTCFRTGSSGRPSDSLLQKLPRMVQTERLGGRKTAGKQPVPADGSGVCHGLCFQLRK